MKLEKHKTCFRDAEIELQAEGHNKPVDVIVN